MKDGNWVPIDKYLVQFLPINRPYTKFEAMFSVTVDIDNNIKRSINGYAKLWDWSRTKVRDFLEKIKTPKKHSRDTLKTLCKHPIRLISNDLSYLKNTLKTGKEQGRDRGLDTTIDPNPNPNPKPKKKMPLSESQFDELINNQEYLNEQSGKLNKSVELVKDKIEDMRDWSLKGNNKVFSVPATLRSWFKKDDKNQSQPAMTPEQEEKLALEAEQYHKERHGK